MKKKDDIGTSDIPEWMIPFKVGQGTVECDGETFTYTVCSRKMAQELKGFLGFSMGQYLFISEDAPLEYRDLELRHEIREVRKYVGHNTPCLAALKDELVEVPANIRKRYIRYRINLFRRLVAYYEGNDSQQFLYDKLKTSLAYLECL